MCAILPFTVIQGFCYLLWPKFITKGIIRVNRSIVNVGVFGTTFHTNTFLSQFSHVDFQGEQCKNHEAEQCECHDFQELNNGAEQCINHHSEPCGEQTAQNRVYHQLCKNYTQLTHSLFIFIQARGNDIETSSRSNNNEKRDSRTRTTETSSATSQKIWFTLDFQLKFLYYPVLVLLLHSLQ